MGTSSVLSFVFVDSSLMSIGWVSVLPVCVIGKGWLAECTLEGSSAARSCQSVIRARVFSSVVASLDDRLSLSLYKPWTESRAESIDFVIRSIVEDSSCW